MLFSVSQVDAQKRETVREYEFYFKQVIYTRVLLFYYSHLKGAFFRDCRHSFLCDEGLRRAKQLTFKSALYMHIHFYGKHVENQKIKFQPCKNTAE